MAIDFIEERTVPQRSAGLAVVFTATLFLSATLLFSVQPMFTKLVLPLLGGASNVWNTAMVFFQAMLLGGYIYAHLSSRYLSLPLQIGLHLGITALGLLFLPLAIGDVDVPASGMPTLWLLGLFTLTVGLPFFALSANAPLLQRWFSLSDHRDADDPYFLYSASNAGSLLVLCAYPLLIEPALRLGSQTALWAGGYLALIAALAVAGWLTARHRSLSAVREPVDSAGSERPVTARRIALWLLLSFVPSSLMLGVTSHMTNNIASAPMLWILPLALYLLTFVIVFARNPWVTSARLAPAIPVLVAVTLAVTAIHGLPSLAVIVIALLSFFLVALFAHARLVESRPDARSLTTFYIVMSLGGVLGGVFNALVAPVLFTGTWEYPLVLVLSALILPSGLALVRPVAGAWVKAGGIAALGVAVSAGLFALGFAPRMALLVGAMLLVAALLPLDMRRAQFLLLAGVLMAAPFVQQLTADSVLLRDRSFFSTLKVQRVTTDHGTVHRFVHGDTVHNFQLRDAGLRTEPVSYYARGGSFDHALQAARRGSGGPLSVAVIGLGAGAMACFEQSGDDWTYFEIDPAVVDIALDPSLFSFVSDCAPGADIRIGDARQRMEGIAPGSQDIVFVDAFSSDSIPAHLVTREALALYRSRLKPGGLVFFHTSNRMLDVTSVVARLAEDAGLSALYVAQDFSGPKAQYASRATGLLVGDSDVLSPIGADGAHWQHWIPSARVRVWSDDYSSVIGPLVAHTLQEGRAVPIPPG